VNLVDAIAATTASLYSGELTDLLPTNSAIAAIGGINAESIIPKRTMDANRAMSLPGT
jgi:hypothetical protein